MTIFERIKTLRKEKGLTQTQLAIAIGYKDKSVISHIEKGEQNLYQDRIQAIAKALDVTPGYLINGYDDIEEKQKSVPATEKQQVLIELVKQLDDNQCDIMSNLIDQILSNRN